MIWQNVEINSHTRNPAAHTPKVNWNVAEANAIDDLCSPKDNYGWASAGIYCFWVYIGLAGDLAERFKQHNGILPTKEGSK